MPARVVESVARPGRSAWLPLFLVAVLAATGSPFWIHCEPQPLGHHFAPRDVALNALLLVPLGIALRHRPWPLAIGAAVLLSGAIEGAQCWLPRDPNLFDFAANVTGAAVGRALPRLPALRPSPLSTALLLTALAAVTLTVALKARAERRPGGFENWKPYPLVIGNEANRNRPWKGLLGELSIYDRALDAAERAALESDAGRSWARGGPVLHLSLAAPAEGRLDGPGGPRPLPLRPPSGEGFELGREGLVSTGGRWILPDTAARHVSERLSSASRFSLHVRLAAGELEVGGPARTVSLSLDQAHRDFTLGQADRDLQLRVRTPGNGRNGDRYSAWTHGGPLDGELQDVWATFDGEVARIFVDGRCHGDALIALSRTRSVTGLMMASTLVAAVALAALAAAAWVAPRARGGAVAAVWLGGGAAFALLWAAGCWEHLPHLAPLAPGLAALTLAAASPVARELSSLGSP